MLPHRQIDLGVLLRAHAKAKFDEKVTKTACLRAHVKRAFCNTCYKILIQKACDSSHV